jgi:uncharacterized protein DUF2726
MSAAIGYLAVLVPVVAIVWIIRAYGRRTAAKEARSRERVAALMAVRQSSGAAPGSAGVVRVAIASVPSPAAAPAAFVASRERFLTQPETLAYYLFKAGLPGYEIFPRVGLASVLAAPEAATGHSLDQSRRAVRYELDFVVCDKNMRVVAAVRLNGRPAGTDGEWAEGCLAAAGIRVVKINPAALPRREQVGALVLGRAE